MPNDWLPPLERFSGDWDSYCERLYTIFHNDFIVSKPIFQGQEVGARRLPITNGKTAAFWHLTSTGEKEDERIPDIRRCERIRWPKAFIENPDKLKIWKNKRKNNTNICLWLDDVTENYLVVLGERDGYYLLRTAYYIEREHSRKKLQKEYEAYTASAATQLNG